jgi:hypothetical protein
MKVNAKIYERNGRNAGRTTGGERQCQMESCRGVRIGVRWKDGTLTFPCTAGMKYRKDNFLQII